VDVDIPRPKAVADIAKLDEVIPAVFPSPHLGLSSCVCGQYMETLYDDSIDERVKGAFMMLQLARDPQYLQHILCNGT
jgi:hypothetical protein